MENRWADPEGTQLRPACVRYQIIDAGTGRLVQRRTSVNLDVGRDRYFHALAPDDQHFADKIVAVVQRACGYFYLPEADYESLEGVPGITISDEEVLARCERLDQGENTREAERLNMTRYPLTDLPLSQQRALVEQVEKIKQDWQFSILGEEPATPPTDGSALNYGYADAPSTAG